MAYTARLLMLLAVTFPIQAIFEAPPDVFPQITSEGEFPDLQTIVDRIEQSCPPLGSPEERFNVEVLGSSKPPIGGCASMQVVHHDIVPAFNLWLGNVKYGGGSCDDTDMNHYMFECLSKHPFKQNDNLKGWYVTLYDRTARWSGKKDYKCGLYSMLNEDPPMIQMVISANRSCDGLSQRMASNDHRVPDGLRHFEDGSVALLFSKDWPHPYSASDVWWKKRSALQDDVLRTETKSQKTRFMESSATTTSDPDRELNFVNPLKAGDAEENFEKIIKYFGTTPSSGDRSIQKRILMNKLFKFFNFRQ